MRPQLIWVKATSGEADRMHKLGSAGVTAKPGGGLGRTGRLPAPVLAATLAAGSVTDRRPGTSRREDASVSGETGVPSSMPPFLFICPNTGFRVQGFASEQTSDDSGERFEAIECILCKRVHLVFPAIGEILGHAGK